MELKIGADPELFIRNKKDGKLISADGLFEGTKENPYPVYCGAVQVDGMAAEYNIIPASNRNMFIAHNVIVLNELRKIIKRNNPTLDFEFVFNPVADFGAEYIAEQREEARRLGCTPDFNAYNGGIPNPTPDAEMPFRTASGHVHLGWGKDYDINDPEHIEACCMMVKQLDCFLMGSLTIEGKDGKRRRELYGKAGAFRPKSYGVEYRVPSNTWLSNTAYMSKIFLNAKDAFDQLIAGIPSYENNGNGTGSYWYGVGPNAERMINEHDLKDYTYNFGSWKQDSRWDGVPVSTSTLAERARDYGYYVTKDDKGPDALPEPVDTATVVQEVKKTYKKAGIKKGDVMFIQEGHNDFDGLHPVQPFDFAQINPAAAPMVEPLNQIDEDDEELGPFDDVDEDVGPAEAALNAAR